MTSMTLSRSIAIGAMTGIRSTSGLAVLGWRHGGLIAAISALMAFGESAVDKMPGVGDRTDSLPLTGRVVLGGWAGGYVARRGRASVMAGALLGATSALITAHLATRARKQLNVPSGAGGVLEDALVVALGALVTGRGRALTPGS